MTAKAPQPVFELRLVALPDAVPAATRLKRLLKMCLRGYGLKCVEAREVPPRDSGNSPGQAAGSAAV
jgi:hypothetical protein